MVSVYRIISGQSWVATSPALVKGTITFTSSTFWRTDNIIAEVLSNRVTTNTYSIKAELKKDIVTITITSSDDTDTSEVPFRLSVGDKFGEFDGLFSVV